MSETKPEPRSRAGDLKCVHIKVKSGVRCTAYSRGGRDTCNAHDPKKLEELAKERDEYADWRSSVASGECTELIRNGKNRGTPCGRLMFGDESVCAQHSQRSIDNMREVCEEYWETKGIAARHHSPKQVTPRSEMSAPIIPATPGNCVHIMKGGPRKGQVCDRYPEGVRNGEPVCFHHTEGRLKHQSERQRQRYEEDGPESNQGLLYTACQHTMVHGLREGKECGRKSAPWSEMCYQHRSRNSSPIPSP